MIKNLKTKFLTLLFLGILVAAYVSPIYHTMADSDVKPLNEAQSEAIVVNGYKINKTTTNNKLLLSMNSNGFHIKIVNDFALKEVTTSVTDQSGKMIVNQTSSTDPLHGLSFGDLTKIGSKVHLVTDSRYWYQVDGNYIRIGCIAKYKVKNTNSHVKA